MVKMSILKVYFQKVAKNNKFWKVAKAIFCQNLVWKVAKFATRSQIWQHCSSAHAYAQSYFKK